MNTNFRIMPVDKTTIRTLIELDPNLYKNPETFILENGLPVRTTKPTRGMSKYGPTRNLTLYLLNYKGIKVKLCQTYDDPLTNATIDFNPGVCLYGHNGRILSLSEFLHALGILVTHLTPLLLNPSDWVDLIPGIRRGGYALWSYLEVPYHCLDPDGALLARMRHLRHPSITTPTRHWPTSIEVGGKRSILQLSIYRKAVEMVEHGKLPASMLPQYQDILRLEARMKNEKLVKYFGNERNVEVIEGVKQLVRFYPQDLVRGHRMCFSELEGVFATGDGAEHAGKIKPNAALGKLLARVALDPRSAQTLPQLMSLLKCYTGASSDTIGDIMDAGMAELSRRSPVSSDNLFSDAAYLAQRDIVSAELEKMVRHDYDDVDPHHLILDAYRPPGLPPKFPTFFPKYIRL